MLLGEHRQTAGCLVEAGWALEVAVALPWEQHQMELAEAWTEELLWEMPRTRCPQSSTRVREPLEHLCEGRKKRCLYHSRPHTR